MRKLIGVIGCIFMLTGSVQGQIPQNAIHTLQEMNTNFTHTENDKEWKVTIKDTIDVNTGKDVLKNVENRHLVASTSSENRVQYKMEINAYKHVDVQVKLNNYMNEDRVEVVIELYGESWDKQIAKEYDTLVAHIEKNYITQNAHVFTCLLSTYSATINRSELVEQIIDGLSLQQVSKETDPLTDPQKQMVFSGYSPHIEEIIYLENANLNVQVVIKMNEEGQISVMIGTPIMIDEY